MKKILCLGLLFVLVSCGEDTPVTPTVVATPSPDPKTDPNSCIETNVKMHGDVEVGFVEHIIVIELLPYNEANVPLTSSCRYPQTAGWNYAGPCLQLGDRTTLTAKFWCLESGYLDIVATHGIFKAVGRVRIVR
jgi:hypothetical protein